MEVPIAGHVSQAEVAFVVRGYLRSYGFLQASAAFEREAAHLLQDLNPPRPGRSLPSILGEYIALKSARSKRTEIARELATANSEGQHVALPGKVGETLRSVWTILKARQGSSGGEPEIEASGDTSSSTDKCLSAPEQGRTAATGARHRRKRQRTRGSPQHHVEASTATGCATGKDEPLSGSRTIAKGVQPPASSTISEVASGSNASAASHHIVHGEIQSTPETLTAFLNHLNYAP